MPNLDLGEFDSVENLKQAGLRLLAHVVFPALEEHEIRRQFLATVIAMPVAEFDSYISTQSSHSVKKALARTKSRSWQYRLLVEVGELETLASAPGLDSIANKLFNSVLGWIVAGELLLLVTRIAHHHSDVRGGASINKAIHLLTFQLDECGYRGPKNEKDLRKRWSKFKPVAHICAAWLVALAGASPVESDFLENHEMGWPFVPFKNERDIGAMVAWARAFQSFGTNFIPHAQKSPILEPSAIWTIPDDLPMPNVELNISPLSQELQDVLMSYRAPKKL